jgi:hypothetical protein
MRSPGALRSTAALALENVDRPSSRSTAATVSTCGSDAGNSGGLPAPNSLPAAATGITPRRTARWIAVYSDRHSVREP